MFANICSSISPLCTSFLENMQKIALVIVFEKCECICTLLIIIVPYRHSIGKCLGVFFLRHSSNKIYSLKLYHLINFTLHSKANACNIGTCFRFYMQMRVEKNPKAFAYRTYSHFTQQCTYM